MVLRLRKTSAYPFTTQTLLPTMSLTRMRPFWPHCWWTFSQGKAKREVLGWQTIVTSTATCPAINKWQQTIRIDQWWASRPILQSQLTTPPPCSHLTNLKHSCTNLVMPCMVFLPWRTMRHSVALQYFGILLNYLHNLWRTMQQNQIFGYICLSL